MATGLLVNRRLSSRLFHGLLDGTRLDLSEFKLSELQKPFLFLDRRWMNREGEACIIQITKKNIEVFGCVVTGNNQQELKTQDMKAKEKKKKKKER